MMLSMFSIQNYSTGDAINSMNSMNSKKQMTCFEFAVFYRSKKTARTRKHSRY